MVKVPADVMRSERLFQIRRLAAMLGHRQSAVVLTIRPLQNETSILINCALDIMQRRKTVTQL